MWFSTLQSGQKIVSLRGHANRVVVRSGLGTTCERDSLLCLKEHCGVGLPSLEHLYQALQSKSTAPEKCSNAGLLLMIPGHSSVSTLDTTVPMLG